MNIFYLDDDIQKCAQYHCDAHVVKMILESAQMLCTAVHLSGGQAPYKATHAKHPCVVWLMESSDNWLWLKSLALALGKEYNHRYAKNHKSIEVVQNLATPAIASRGITERPQAMPEQYQIPGDPVTAYRQYYLAEKAHLLKYSGREVPAWVINEA